MKVRLFRRSRRVSERGEGQTQLIVTLSIVGLLAFVAIKVVPVYWQEKNVKYELEELNRKVSVGSKGYIKDEEIRDAGKRMLDGNQVPEDAKFDVVKSGGTVTSKVIYTVPIEFYVYTYNWEVNLEVKDATGRY
jgi:hypothetical protein